MKLELTIVHKMSFMDAQGASEEGIGTASFMIDSEQPPEASVGAMMQAAMVAGEAAGEDLSQHFIDFIKARGLI